MPKVEEIRALIKELDKTSDKARLCETFRTKFSELNATETAQIAPQDLVKVYRIAKQNTVIAFYRTPTANGTTPNRNIQTDRSRHNLVNKHLTQQQIQNLIDAIGTQTDATTGTISGNLKYMLLDLAKEKGFTIQQKTTQRPSTAPQERQTTQRSTAKHYNTTEKPRNESKEDPQSPYYYGTYFEDNWLGNRQIGVRRLQFINLNKTIAEQTEQTEQTDNAIQQGPLFSPLGSEWTSHAIARTDDASNARHITVRGIPEEGQDNELNRANVEKLIRPNTSPAVLRDRRSGTQYTEEEDPAIALAKQTLTKWVEAVGIEKGRQSKNKRRYDADLDEVIKRIVTNLMPDSKEKEIIIDRERKLSVVTDDPEIPFAHQRELPFSRFLSDFLIEATQRVNQNPNAPEVINFLTNIGLSQPTQKESPRPSTPYTPPPTQSQRSPRSAVLSNPRDGMGTIEEEEFRIHKPRDLTELSDENDILRESVKQLQQQLADAKAANETMAEENKRLEQKKTRNTQLRSALANLEKELQRLQDDNRTLTIQQSQFQSERAQLEQALAQLRKQLDEEKAKNEALQQTTPPPEKTAVYTQTSFTDSMMESTSATVSADVGKVGATEINATSSSSQITEENGKEMDEIERLVLRRIGAGNFASTIKILQTCSEKFRLCNSLESTKSVLKDKSLKPEQRFALISCFCDGFKEKNITSESIEKSLKSGTSNSLIEQSITQAASQLTSYSSALILKFKPDQALDLRPNGSTKLRSAVGALSAVRALRHSSNNSGSSQSY